MEKIVTERELRLRRAEKMVQKLRAWSLGLEFLPYMFNLELLTDEECFSLSLKFPFTQSELRQHFPSGTN